MVGIDSLSQLSTYATMFFTGENEVVSQLVALTNGQRLCSNPGIGRLVPKGLANVCPCDV